MKKKIYLLLFITVFCKLFPADINGFDYIPYQGIFKTIETKNFSVLFPKKFEKNAVKTAFYAEEIYQKLMPSFSWKPITKTIIIISDHTDQPNGLAYTYPRNTIQLYITSTDSIDSLRDFNDPLYSLLLHEMTHIFQIDQIRGAAFFWRIMHGRLYFPVLGSFTWFLEGTAVYNESVFTGTGRLNGNFHKELIKKSAEKKAIPDFDDLVSPVSTWPYGDSIYQFGAAFTNYIINTYGKEKFNAFNKDLSNDFWPFIYEFVIKFKKIYGKTLNALWDEWRNYEYNRYSATQENDAFFIKENSEIGFFDLYKNDFYYSSYSIKNGYGIYKKNPSGKDKKVGLDFTEKFTFTENGILYIKNNSAPGDFTYSDLYFSSFNGTRRKRLTYNLRVKSVTYNPNKNIGIYIKNNNFYLFNIKNRKITTISEIILADFVFVDDIDISNSGNTFVFSGRKSNNDNYAIGIVDITTKNITVFDKIKGKKVSFITDNDILFVGKISSGEDRVFKYNISDEIINILPGNENYIKSAFINDGFIYKHLLDNNGEIVSKAKYEAGVPFTTEFFFTPPPQIQIEKCEYKSTNYIPLKYLYPTIWALIPYQLQSTFQVPFLGLETKNIAPAFLIYNRSPLGRFNYMVTTAFDYVKTYPETEIQLQFKLPLLNINYDFYTYKTGGNFFGYYPAVFYNYLSFNPYISIDNNNLFNFFISGSIALQQNDNEFINFTYSSTLSTSIYYTYAHKHPGSNSWNAGLQLKSSAFSQFYKTKNYAFMLNTGIETRIPLDKHYFFLKNSGGYNLIGPTLFFIGSNNLLFNQSIIGNSSNSINVIDFKGLSLDFNNYHTAKGYIYASSGFHFIIYRKTHYWHFLTAGFRGLYIKPFSEFAISINNNCNYLIDSGTELIVDLFAAYGNIDIELKQGNVISYEIGKAYPIYNGYFYINLGL